MTDDAEDGPRWWPLLTAGPHPDEPRGLAPRTHEVERFEGDRLRAICEILKVSEESEIVRRLEWALARANKYQPLKLGMVVTRDQRRNAESVASMLRKILKRWEDLGGLNALMTDAWDIAGDETGPETLGLPHGYGESGDHYVYLERLAHCVEWLVEYAPRFARSRGRSEDDWQFTKVQFCVEVFIRARGEIPKISRNASGEREGEILDLVLNAVGASHPELVAREIARREELGNLGI